MTLVWVCVAHQGGLLDDLKVVGSEAAAIAIKSRWADGMECEEDPESGGEVFYDANESPWFFEVWPTQVETA